MYHPVTDQITHGCSESVACAGRDLEVPVVGDGELRVGTTRAVSRGMAKHRTATITAVSLEVLCPFCGEPQPNPNTGSHTWLPHEVADAAAKAGARILCTACDAMSLLHSRSRVTVND